MDRSLNVAVIGLGYVGLPLTVGFAKVRQVIGFDIDSDRVKQLKQNIDETLEVSKDELASSHNITFTDRVEEIVVANCYIITVPTPINSAKKPDLGALMAASSTVGSVLKSGDIVIYESTVYPGCVEQDCVPVLERTSGLFFNSDFFCGYSPERINPGDRQHTLSSVVKVTAGSTPETAKIVDDLYSEIITAGTHCAESIKVAEAAKVIENTQRDLNIAFVNELAMIFELLDLDTNAILDAAATKWNFLPFRPGLVGGHCIGVDPYYLTHRAESLGYYPQIILSGRRLNDGMAPYVAQRLVKALLAKKINPAKAKVLVLGFTFKENCPDFRNTQVIKVIKELEEYSCKVEVYDPWPTKSKVAKEYGIHLIAEPTGCDYDAVLVAVGHACFRDLGIDWIKNRCRSDRVIFDLKSMFAKGDADLRL